MYGNVRESPNLFNPFFLACETYQGKLTTVVVLFQVKLVGFELLEGGKLRDVQTGLNNNLHAIYGGVQFGRVAWEVVSGLSSMWESNGFDLPWNSLVAPENQYKSMVGRCPFGMVYFQRITWPMAKPFQLFGVTYLVGRISRSNFFFSVRWLIEGGYVSFWECNWFFLIFGFPRKVPEEDTPFLLIVKVIFFNQTGLKPRLGMSDVHLT